MSTPNKTWDLVIETRSSLFSLNLREVWQYRDLLEMYIRRDIVTFYKQTILGPIWFFVQPIFTTIVLPGGLDLLLYEPRHETAI